MEDTSAVIVNIFISHKNVIKNFFFQFHQNSWAKPTWLFDVKIHCYRKKQTEHEYKNWMSVGFVTHRVKEHSETTWPFKALADLTTFLH